MLMMESLLLYANNCVPAPVPLCRGGGPTASVVACRRCRLSGAAAAAAGRGRPGERELSPVGACVVQGAFPSGCRHRLTHHRSAPEAVTHM